MPNFIVDLKLQIGEYEKNTVHNITAVTKQQAMLQALADESHGNANLQSDGVWWDLGGEMAYCVREARIITDEQSDMLHDLGMYASVYDPDHILDMIDEDAEVRDIDVLLSYLS